MNRHLIWIIAGTSMLGLGIPAFAAARSAGTPDDNGVPGEVRGNCDEAEHANDPNCLAVLVPDTTAGPIVVTVPSTSPNTLPSKTVAGNTTPGNTTPGNTTPGNTVPGTSVENGSPVDVSGPCDEAEHANDPRCTGGGVDDNSGRDGTNDGVDHDLVDDNSGRDGSDDDDHSSDGHDGRDDDDGRSGHGGGSDD